MSTLKSRIIACGSYAPDKVIKNTDIEKMVSTNDSWITERTGIKERRITINEKTSEVAAKAARNALRSSGLSPKDIDLVVAGTVTSDMLFPSVACFVQSSLGIKPGVPAFDVSAACSGFLYALDVTDKYIRGGGIKNALVIGVDVFSRIIDWTDRTTCILFGDGAGAAVVSSTHGKSGILSSHIHSDGSYWEMLYAPSAIGNNPFEKKNPLSQKPHLKMKGNELFKIAVRTMGDGIKEALSHNGLKPEELSLLIPHQANIRIINAIKERLQIPSDRVFSNIEKYGNTSAGSIPIALDEAVRTNRINKGDIILFVSFGGGLTWGSTLIRW